jgi:hypothetical protein
MGMAVTDTMLTLRAEVYPGQEMRDISIGEFSLRLADELANNKVDGDIVRPTQGKRTIYPALIDVQVKRYILLAYPLQYLLCLYNFHFLFSTLLLFSFFNYDSIFNPSRRPQRAPTSEGIGSSLSARKKMESLASAVARVAKRRREVLPSVGTEPQVCVHLQSFYSWLLSPASPEGTRSRSRDERTNR